MKKNYINLTYIFFSICYLFFGSAIAQKNNSAGTDCKTLNFAKTAKQNCKEMGQNGSKYESTKNGIGLKFTLGPNQPATANDKSGKRDRNEWRDDNVGGKGVETISFTLNAANTSKTKSTVILGQVHSGGTDGFPIISNRCKAGKCWVNLQSAKGKTDKKFAISLDKSSNIKYEINWSSGNVTVSINGKVIGSHKLKLGKVSPYVKLGLYSPNDKGEKLSENLTVEYSNYLRSK
jgi:hypothetical protein